MQTTPMTTHFILTLDPHATYDWDRCTLRHPLTADCPSLAALVSAQVGQTSGQFLVVVEVKVTVLETVMTQTGLPDGMSPEPGLLESESYATEPVPAVQAS